jgi:UDP-N-acetyl-D-glucosamine dehydrogenase
MCISGRTLAQVVAFIDNAPCVRRSGRRKRLENHMRENDSSSQKNTAMPTAEEASRELERVRALASEARTQGREVTVVIGLGFVGVVMAAVIADSADANGKPGKFVIGLQRPSPRSFWKIAVLNRGEAPVVSEDKNVAVLIRRCVTEKKTMTATYVEEAISLADVIVVDIQCDFVKSAIGNVRSGTVDMIALEETFAQIGRLAPANALILIETTVAPGTTEQIAFPIIKQEFEKRQIKETPLLAHSSERVMPGRNYVASVRDFWRVCSGINKEAKERIVKFLNEVLNTKDFPLTVLDRPIESETA